MMVVRGGHMKMQQLTVSEPNRWCAVMIKDLGRGWVPGWNPY